jgi:hypothetical protein
MGHNPSRGPVVSGFGVKIGQCDDAAALAVIGMACTVAHATLVGEFSNECMTHAEIAEFLRDCRYATTESSWAIML